MSPSVGIIGGGFGGIAMAVRLLRAGVRDVTIYEKSAGAGGTWYDNRYPGVECDVASELYSFSFHLGTWDRTHAGGAAIRAYLDEVIDGFALRPLFRFGVSIDRAVWDESAQRWTLIAHDGDTMTHDVVVSAVGLLNVPRYPDWPGMSDFLGPVFHTARWEDGHDLRGKRVAVVGAGSTSAQVVPSLAGHAGKVVTFIREAPYVLPKHDHLYGPEETRRFSSTWRKRLFRARAMREYDRYAATFDPTSARSAGGRAFALKHLRTTLASRPDLVEALTPTYPYRCKRVTVSSTFYPALLRDDVEVVPRAVVSMTPHGLVDDQGEEHEVDAVVLATGFQPWNFLAQLEVVGRGNRSLHGVWGDEPEGFFGMAMPDFPNFFMLYGPNTNGVCLSFMLERQAEFVARQVRRLGRRGRTTLEVGSVAMALYRRYLDRRLARASVFEGGCNSYYHSASGRNVTQWPATHLRYWVLTRTLAPFGVRARRGVPASRLRAADGVRARSSAVTTG